MEYFLPHMMRHLEEYDLSGDLTFVYGDTHDGGWGELSLPGGRDMRVYNTGGWVTYDIEDHPTCYIFAVGEDGIEYLLDVSFKEAYLNENLLLKTTSDSSESQKSKAGNVIRDFLGSGPHICPVRVVDSTQPALYVTSRQDRVWMKQIGSRC
jgi:hypothetical protein